MSYDEDNVLVCMRVADLPTPYVPCDKTKCRICHKEVWYSKYVYANDPIIKKIVDDGDAICLQCVNETLKNSLREAG